MTATLLATKLYIPTPRTHTVVRARLWTQLNLSLERKLCLVSAPAGFGKTTVVSAWLQTIQQPRAWLSLDSGDSDLQRFLLYLVHALQTLDSHVGQSFTSLLRAPQPPPLESLLTMLLNDLVAMQQAFVLVLDDYHMVEHTEIDQAITFLVEHAPPTMHLIIITREDPQLPLARLRVRQQLQEIRVHDLRFTLQEATDFLNQTMHLSLATADVAQLEQRTEGWIAGLQLAALSLQGHANTSKFIESFAGSHHFVLDYLVEEVLQQQSDDRQRFLLRTSLLDRMCGELCDSVLGHTNSQATLLELEQANVFIVPLDTERRWYRYHHLFAELLRQRLAQSPWENQTIALHQRASDWYAAHDLQLEAFQHAVAANDLDRATHLVEGNGISLPFRGIIQPVLHWLETLSTTDLNHRPGLWVMYASALLFANQVVGVEAKLQAAEAVLQHQALTAYERNLVGHIAAIRSIIAATQHEVTSIIEQAERALVYLSPHNLAVRTATIWTLGYAYQLQGERATARKWYDQAITTSETIGHTIIEIMSLIGLANLQELDHQFQAATTTSQRIIQLCGDPAIPVACEAYLILARIAYEWNDLPTARLHGQEALRLARQMERVDRYIDCEVLLARLQCAEGDLLGARVRLEQAADWSQRYGFVHRLPLIVAIQVQIFLGQGFIEHAAQRSQSYDLPLTQARISLAQGNPQTAYDALEPFRQTAETRGWVNLQFQALMLQALALHQLDQSEQTRVVLKQALELAEPAGLIRSFVDEGSAMQHLLQTHSAVRPAYISSIIAAFPVQKATSVQALIEPLSEREGEILQLIAQGYSNQQISEQLVLALSTVKGHNRNLFDKLQATRRTEAVARARELGLL